MKFALLAMLCAATVIAYLQRSALGVPSKRIEADLGIDPGGLGLVWLGWYAAYAVFQLPSGWLADRLGSKVALVLFALLWSAITGVVGAATGFVGLLVLWSLMGGAQAGIFPCATKGIRATFPQTSRAFASGCLACCMAGGAALAQWLTGELIGPLSWQQILVVYAAPGIAWAVLFAALVPSPDPPRATPVKPSNGLPVRWSRLATDPNMVLLCGQQFLRAAATALFFTWFPRYLQETKGVTIEQSGTLAAVPLIAGMAGGLIGGTFSDFLLRRTGNPRLSRQGLAFSSMLVCVGVSLAAYRAADAGTAVGLVSVAAFFGYVGGVSAYATAMAMGGTRVAPVFATMNMAGNVGAGLFPFAVGRLVAATGNWDQTLLLFALLYAVSALCWALLNPKGTLFEEDADDHPDDPR